LKYKLKHKISPFVTISHNVTVKVIVSHTSTSNCWLIMAKSRTFNVRLPEDLVAWLDERARRERRSRNQLIKIILEDARAALPTEQPSRAENESPKTLQPPQIRLRRAY